MPQSHRCFCANHSRHIELREEIVRLCRKVSKATRNRHRKPGKAARLAHRLASLRIELSSLTRCRSAR